MNSGYSGSYWTGGGNSKKEEKARAEDVHKRLMAASAMTHDLDSELSELKFWVEIEGIQFQPQDVKSVKSYVDKAYDLLQSIYMDVSEFSGRPELERLSIAEANEAVQPALRIEAKAREFRQWLTKAREAKDKLDMPRNNAATVLEQAERKRLQSEAELSQARRQIKDLELSHAENLPEAKAALITAEREILAGSQMVQSGQQALMRKSFREALDLGERSQKILDSGISRFVHIKFALEKNNQASGDADDALAKALQRLQEAKDTLAARAKILSQTPNNYLQTAIQRLGEARRAFKSNPPQFMTTYRLANEALTLIDEALERANEETRYLRDSRSTTRQLSQQLNDTLIDLRSTINSRQAVPVRVNELYIKARDRRDRLTGQAIDNLSVPELTRLSVDLQAALKTAQDALTLLNKGF